MLKELSKELPQLIPLTKPNSGHGATLLYGYNYSIEQNAKYVFQTDSDGQTLPEEFWQFWDQRDDFSMLAVYRSRRQDGFLSIIVTKVLKFTLWCVFGLNITDANSPFRLFRAEFLRKYIHMIPRDFNLSNVMLAVLFVRYGEPVKFIPISFRQRQGGVNSINLGRIIKIGFKAVKDFMHIKKELDKNGIK
jgi:hypothetical protein